MKKVKDAPKRQVKDDKPEIIEAVDDAAELYYEYKAANPTFGTAQESDSAEKVYAAAKAADKHLQAAEGGGNVQYNSDGELTQKKSKSQPETLQPVDHSKIDYPDFTRNIYQPSDAVNRLTATNIRELNNRMGITVTGLNPAKTVGTWEHFDGWEATLHAEIKKQQFEAPTAIQAAAIPNALSGRDILAIAQTGSGKTLAYIIPVVLHVATQPQLPKGDGPIAIILTPTRELAQQVHTSTKNFSKLYKLKCLPIFGGKDKGDQIRALKAGSDIVVCTPGRMLEMIGKAKACSCKAVTILVVDEADRMFELGYEHQAMSILGQIRPSRQTLLFSATLPGKVEQLASTLLSSPLRIVVGNAGQVNDRVQHHIKVLKSKTEKWDALLDILPMAKLRGLTLLFVNQRATCDWLCSQMCSAGYMAASIHGDNDQEKREDALQAFRSASLGFLVGTDLLSRGVDICDVNTIINYDVPSCIDSYIHRVGRTARREGESGIAYTFILATDKDACSIAGGLVDTLETVGHDVPQDLLDLAETSQKFRSKRNSILNVMKTGKPPPGNRRGKGGAGLGYDPAAASRNKQSHQQQQQQGGGGGGKKKGLTSSLGGVMAMMGFVPAKEQSKPNQKPKITLPQNVPQQQPQQSQQQQQPEQLADPAASSEAPKKKHFVVLPKKSAPPPAPVHYDSIAREPPPQAMLGPGGPAVLGTVGGGVVSVDPAVLAMHAAANQASQFSKPRNNKRRRGRSYSSSDSSGGWRRRRKDRRRRKQGGSVSSSSYSSYSSRSRSPRRGRGRDRDRGSRRRRDSSSSSDSYYRKRR
eukprot:TRINITY_DN67753_c1_g1_i1.p1 TRINITY_DN67753_c1_g1~~TRINITY_DN67753_c1_g1_i1.p1  ORF type:complete len:861 (+),score=107.75 TRINITY_DN67753_c1_g1_i1:153-2585(+)